MTLWPRALPSYGTPRGGACALHHGPRRTLWATLDKVSERSWWHTADGPGPDSQRLVQPQPGRARRAYAWSWRGEDAYLLSSRRCGATLGQLWCWRPGRPYPDWWLDQELAWHDRRTRRAILRAPAGDLSLWHLGDAPTHLRDLGGQDLARSQRQASLLPAPVLSPDGQAVAYVRSGGHLVLHHLEPDRQTPSLLPRREIQRALFLPWGTDLLAVDTDGALHRLDRQGRHLGSLRPPEGYTPNPETLTPLRQRRHLLAPCEEGGCLLWDVERGELLHAVEPFTRADGFEEGVASLVAPQEAQGRAWLCPMSHRLLALDLERGRWLGSLEAAEPLLALRATEDGATLVAGDHQGAVSWLDATGWAEAAPAAP